MTYLSFHFLFTIPLFFAALIINWKNPKIFEGRSWLATLTLLLLAVGYTTPWDSFLIQSGVWSYPDQRVLYTILQIPIEEYFFFVIQTLIGCLLTMKIMEKVPGRSELYKPSTADRVFVIALSVALILPTLYSFQFAFHENPYRYLFLITGWASPIILLQWAIGYRILLKFKWRLLAAVVPLTLYFWCADWFAISRGIWFFPEGQSTGWTIGPTLPIEEALFFLMTNLMVVQGFILFTHFTKKEMPVKLGGQPFKP